MLFNRDRLAELFHLQQFALDHLLRQFDQYIKNAEIALLHGNLEGLHVEPVASQHAFRVAPLGVSRRTPAANLSLINDVVMDERRGMNNFDNRCELDRARTLVAHQLRGQQQQRRANPLASSSAQVFANFCDRRDVRDRVVPELLFDGDNVVVQQVEDLFPVDGAGCAQCSNLSPPRRRVRQDKLFDKPPSLQ